MWDANLGFKCKTPFVVVSKWFTVSYTKRASKWIHQSRVRVFKFQMVFEETQENK